MSQLTDIRKDLRAAATPQRAEASARFFKTGPGEYGEGDKFIGVSVPDQRKIAKKYKDISLNEAEELLGSPVHEERLVALFVLVGIFQKGSEADKQNIFDFYLKNASKVNNWDLVDSSAPYLGQYLLDRDRSILTKLAKSDNLWERRIAIMTSFAFIMHGESKTTFEIADILLNDPHDLIQKAVGWMLREVGKRVSQAEEEAFLASRYKSMPRTMLRYAIERFDEPLRKAYLEGSIK